MGSANFCASQSLADDAAKLKLHFEMSGLQGIEAGDQVVSETLKGFDASAIITVVDHLGLQAGSVFNIALYKRWLELWTGQSTSEFAIWFNLGVQFAEAGDKTNSITCYQNALTLKADFYQAALNLGTAYETTGQTDLALATWTKALQPDEARIALLNNRGRVLENAKQLKEAEQAFTNSLLTDPKQPGVLHHWIGLRTRMCVWPVFSDAIPGVTHTEMIAATRALTLLALVDDVALQDEGNQSWVDEKHPAAPCRLSPVDGYRHAKLRIGYMSSDFCMHPIAYLITELFEHHDRQAFEIYGYCSTKDDGSAVRQRIIRSFDKYRDIRSLGDEAAARLIRDDEIDILIDLNGLTLGTRLQVLRWRPAPVQVTYLGYNGPVPLPELDYIIADEFVIPPSMAAHYRPRPLYIEGCYQVNDGSLEVAVPPSRHDVGLPDDRFVFCCFSNTYKITESIFDLWMNILRRADRSVLWLFADNVHAMDNMRQRAARAGIEESRLIFSKRVEPQQYRGRLALADLFLDTFPYNAGTTASDALRVGLPLITLSGESFIARMAGSILKSMDLEECIVYCANDYVNLAVQIAEDKNLYKSIRAKITSDAWRSTLGNISGFCEKLENSLKSIALFPAGAEKKPAAPAHNACELIIS